MRQLLFCCLLMASVPALAEDKSGQQLFEGYCAMCHQLPDPEMLNARQWQRVMLTMQKRMQQADMTPLNDDEFAAILDYLSQQSGR